jgi:ATP-binding cassette subfamily B protein
MTARYPIPSLVALVAVGAVQHFGAAAEQERSNLLRELVGQHAEGRIIDVAGRVDLAVFQA